MAQPGPNPQTNLIISIVAPVVALITIAVLFFTRPQPVAPPPVANVNTAASKLPASGLTPVNALPNAGTGTGNSGVMGGAGGPGAPGAPGGPPSRKKNGGVSPSAGS